MEHIQTNGMAKAANKVILKLQKNDVCGGSFNMTFQKKCHIILYKTTF